MTAPLTKSYVNTHDPNKPIQVEDRLAYRRFEQARAGGCAGEFVNLDTGERITTTAIFAKSDEYAKGLLSLGLVPGVDNIVALGVCTMEAVCLYVAALASGIGYAHPDVHSPRDNSIVLQAGLVSPKVVVCGEGSGGLTFPAVMSLFDENADTPTSSKLPSVKHVFYDDSYKGRSPPQKFLRTLDRLIELGKSISDEQLMEAKRNVRPEFVAFHLFTSGSTGPPKCVSHTNMSVCMDPLPIKMTTLLTVNFNTDAMAAYLIAGFILGGLADKAVMVPETYAEQSMADFGKVIAQGIIDEKAEYVCLQPGSLRIFLNYLLSAERTLHSVKAVLYGGILVNKSLINDCWKCFNAPAVAGYGMSECFSIGWEKPGPPVQSEGFIVESIYYSRANSELRLVNDKNEVVDIGESGEIQVKSVSVLKEYRGDKQKTAELFTDDGYIRTGDLAVMDSSGGFVIKGRIGDSTRFKIFNKVEYPGPIEQIINRHPDISEAAVVAGIQNEWMGDEVTFCIVMETGSKQLDEIEFLEFCRQNGMNNDRQRPARILYFNTLPTTSNGRKASRKELLKTVRTIIEENKDVGKCQWFTDMEKSVSLM